MNDKKTGDNILKIHQEIKKLQAFWQETSVLNFGTFTVACEPLCQ